MLKRGYRDMMRGVDAETISRAIDAYVHSERDREIVKLCLLNGISYTRIADRLPEWVSPRTIQNVLNRCMPVILEHIKR